MVNSCSVYGCKSNYKTTGNGNYVTVFKFPDNTTKQTEWLRKLPNKDFQITKTSRVCFKHLNHTSSSDTMHFHVQMVILT